MIFVLKQILLEKILTHRIVPTFLWSHFNNCVIVEKERLQTEHIEFRFLIKLLKIIKKKYLYLNLCSVYEYTSSFKNQNLMHTIRIFRLFYKREVI